MSPSHVLVPLALLAPLIAHADESPDQDPNSEQVFSDDSAADANEDAEEWDDESLVVVVETEGGVPRVAGSAHIVDEEELVRFEYDDIHQVLAGIPGVYVRGEDGFGLRPNIGLRGANSDRSAKVTLMEDGVLLAPAPYAAPAAYFFPVTTRMVGVEVFKGAAATRHGPQTIGGAVNLLTRPVPEAASAGFDIAGGLRNTLKVHGFAGSSNDHWGFLVEGVHLGTKGFKQLDGGGPTGFIHDEVMVKGRWNSDTSATWTHALELKGGYTFENSYETYLGLTLSDFEETPYRRYAASQNDIMRWHRTQAELSWIVTGGKDFDLRTVAYHHYLDRAWTKLNRFAKGPDLHNLLQNPDGSLARVYMGVLRGEEDSLTSDQNLLIGTNDRQYHSFGVQSVGHWRASSGNIRSQLEFGLRGHGDIVDRYHTEETFAMRDGQLEQVEEPIAVNTDTRATAAAIAAYVHEDLGIGAFRITPGIRVEAIATTLKPQGGETPAADWTVVPLPGIGLLGEPVTGWSLFAGVHRGFTPVAPGSPEGTKPESSVNYEAGTRLDMSNTRFEAVGFFNDYSNFAGQCTFSSGCDDNELDTQFNAGRVFVYGAEGMLAHTFNFRKGVELTLSGTYTFTDSIFRTSFFSPFPQFGQVSEGDKLPYVPMHQGAFRLLIGHPRFSLSFAANARSGMRDVASMGPLSPDTDVPATYRLDVAGDVVITKNFTLYATFTNVTNFAAMESWRPFGARPSQPFQFMGGIKIGLGGAQTAL